MTNKVFCFCGQPLHYNDKNIQRIVQAMVDKLGEYVEVSLPDKTYKVPRHYIALHGLRASELPLLGFEEVK